MRMGEVLFLFMFAVSKWDFFPDAQSGIDFRPVLLDGEGFGGGLDGRL